MSQMQTQPLAGSVAEGMPTAFVRDARTWLMYLLLALFGFSQGVLPSVMPFLRDELALNTKAVSWHFSVYAVGIFLSGFPSRWLLHRVDRLVLAWASIASVAVAVLLFAAGANVVTTLANAFLVGLTGGVAQTTIQADLAVHHGERRDVAVTEAYIVAAVGVFLCPLIIGRTPQVGLDWRWALVVPLVGLAILALGFRGAVGRGGGHEVAEARAQGGPLPATVYVCWALVLLGISTEWGTAFWGAQFLEQQLSMAPASAVTMMSLFFGGTIVGRTFNSRLLRHLSSAPLLAISIAAGGGAVLLLWAVPAMAAAAIALVVAGFCLGNFYPLILGVALRAAPDQAASVSAGCAQAVGVALLTAPMALGLLSERIGLVNAVGALTAFPLLMAVLLATTRRK
ncbi:MFS transporter [Pendulispora albinea]|uniref:MFS transporter n=1 Tax=Pendulispora albinea TaxID=2741071 RepID=A0ABZ2M1P2_9BACT